MSVEITPPKLNINPVLVACGSVENVLTIGNQGRTRNVPLVGREQEDVGTRRVHLVTLSRMNSFLLDSLDLQRFKLLIENLTQIHDNTLVN
jgi:hypothetical protein